MVSLLDKQLLKRLNYPVQQIPCTADSYGDKIEGIPLDLLCYRIGKITIVKDVKGVEVVSTLHLLFDGILTIGTLDEFILGTKSYPLIAFTIITGVGKDPGITVVYL